MVIQKIDFDKAKEMTGDYNNSLLYYISSTELSVSGKVDINWNECKEARFFSEKNELRFYKDSSEWIVTLISDEGEEKTIDVKYELDNRFLTKGRYFTVREYFRPDEDGQMVLIAKRLVSVE